MTIWLDWTVTRRPSRKCCDPDAGAGADTDADAHGKLLMGQSRLTRAQHDETETGLFASGGALAEICTMEPLCICMIAAFRRRV